MGFKRIQQILLHFTVRALNLLNILNHISLQEMRCRKSIIKCIKKNLLNCITIFLYGIVVPEP